MKKKLIVTSIVVLTVIITITLFRDMIVPVSMHGRAANLVDEYQDYYFKDVWIRGFSPFGTNNWFRYIFFLPGQRTGMRNKIKEDMVNKLETLIEEHGDVIYKYEINNDFKGVRIYIASGDIDRNKLYDINREMREKFGALLELYNCVKAGRPGSMNGVDGHGVIFVEPDE